MENHYRKEIPVPVDGLPGHFEWWEVGIDFDDSGHGELLLCYAGIRSTDAPVSVMKAAIAQWAEWLATI